MAKCRRKNLAENRALMRYFVLLSLAVLLLLLPPRMAVAAEPKPKSVSAGSSDHEALPSRPETDQDAAQKTDDAGSDAAENGSADADSPKRPKAGAFPTSLSVVSVPGGMKAISVHFRWSLFSNSSVEVRLVPGPLRKGAAVAPVYFAEQLKDKVRHELYECLDHPGAAGRNYSFTKDSTTFEMIGRRNSLGNQGVHIEVHPDEHGSPKANPAVVYLQLDTWAVGRESLTLDLPREQFSKPGTLFVWFFRGNDVVWEEQIRWPGYK
jgi:hypothetical protein